MEKRLAMVEFVLLGRIVQKVGEISLKPGIHHLLRDSQWLNECLIFVNKLW
jgi:hypothetical protein